jgi:hypothetical protein
MPHVSPVGVAHDEQDRVASAALVPPDPGVRAFDEWHRFPFTLMCEDRGLSAFRTSAAGCEPTLRRNPGSRRGARPYGLAQIGQAPGSRQPTPRPGAGPAPHPETRWAALALACPGDSVRGIGHHQPTHQATPGYRSIDRIMTVGVPSRPVKDGCRALRRDRAHRCSPCRRERVKSPCPGCGSWRLLLPGTGRCAT